MQNLYRFDQWTLPAPCFPFVSDETQEPLWKLVRQSQNSVLADTQSEGGVLSFGLKQGFAPVKFEKDEKARVLETVRCLCLYAQLFGEPLTAKTLLRANGVHPAWACRVIAPFVAATVSTKEFMRFVSGEYIPDRQECAEWIADKVKNWLDLPSIAQWAQGFDSVIYAPFEDVLKPMTDDWTIGFL